MSEANTLSEHLIVRCDPEFLDRADAVAESYGINRSAAIRMLVTREYRELDSTDADD